MELAPCADAITSVPDIDELTADQLNARRRLVWRGRAAARAQRHPNYQPPQSQGTWVPPSADPHGDLLRDGLTQMIVLLRNVVERVDALTRNTEESADGEYKQYVTLDQAAAIVGRAKKTVERAIARDLDAPAPNIEGGGGNRHEWIWSEIRVWLEKKYGRRLPERYPSLQPK